MLATLLAACGARGVQVNQLGPEELYEYAEAQFLAGDWTEAIRALERFVLVNPTHGRAQEARYRLGQAYFERGDYITAAAEFNRIASEYPLSPWADDSRFNVCAAYEELSPRPELDQQYTLSAVDHCRSLIDMYPDSEHVPAAREIIMELRARLAEKLYKEGEFYFGRRAYHPANLSYRLVVEEYDDTVWAPRALLRMYEGFRRLGYTEEAAEMRAQLLRDYPDSTEARQIGIGAAAVP